MIIRNCIREGRPYPESIANAPFVEVGHAFYFEAFSDLATERRYSGGAIPYTAIRDYVVEFELDDDGADILTKVIRNVDVWFINFVRERTEKEQAKNKPRTTKKPARRGRK